MNNLLKWSAALLFAISGFFVRGWYTKVNDRLDYIEARNSLDHLELAVLTERTRSIDERVSDVDAKMDLVLNKLDKIREQTK